MEHYKTSFHRYSLCYQTIIKIILSVSEGFICEEVWKRNENGERKVVLAKYTYPDGFCLTEEMNNSYDGIIYKRDS